MKKLILLTTIFILFASLAFAKAYFAGKKEMIEKAECIAIIEINKIEEIEQKGKHWTYRQKAIGTVEKQLKGDIQRNIIIYGMEDFICAQCIFMEGRFLLFLRKDKNFWVGSNWRLSIRPIKQKYIEWFKDDDSLFEMEEKPLVEVISEIENILLENKELLTNQSTGPNSPPPAAP